MSNFSLKSNIQFKKHPEDHEDKLFAEIQIFKKGKFKRPSFFGEDQEFTLGNKQFDTAIENFNKGIPAKEIVLNFQHNSDNPNPEISAAAGWFGVGRLGTEIFKRGTGLFARVEILPETKEFIEKEEFLFSSAEFSDKFKNEKGEDKGFTVTGLALTNTPFLRNMSKNQLLSTYEFADDGGQLKMFALEEITDKKELTIMEANKFTELAGVKTLDEALEHFTKLKSNEDENGEIDGGKINNTINAVAQQEITKLASEVQSLKADKTATDGIIKCLADNQNQTELQKRKDVLKNLFSASELKIDAAQLATAMFAYVDIDSDRVSHTQTLYDMYVETMKSMPKRHDLVLLNNKGEGAIASDGTSQKKDVMAMVNKYAAENKCSFTKAYEFMKLDQSKLMAEYEKQDYED